MHQEHYAYGVAVKLAEYGISPEQFIHAAAQSQNPDAMKVAHELYAALQYEQIKQAAVPRKFKGFDEAPQYLMDAVEALGPSGGPVSSRFHGFDGVPEFMIDTAVAGPMADLRMLGKHTVQDRGFRERAAAGALGVGAASASALGAGGIAYGMGDADTVSNRLRRASNEYLGTNLDTQSRFQALLGR